MKKLLLAIMLLIIIGLVSAYLFIPSTIRVKAVAESPVSSKAAYRYLINDDSWAKWWPGEKTFYYDGAEFTLNKKLLSAFEIQFRLKSHTVNTTLEIVPLSKDLTAIAWGCEIKSGKNPFARWMQYFKAWQIKNRLDDLISVLKNHLEKQENIYGFSVKKTKVVDSVLISTKGSFDHYPGIKEVDSLVQKLKFYVKKEKASEKNYPMLHIFQTGSGMYEAMVAISTDQLLPITSEFVPKFVLKGGNILEAEFKGGPYSTKKAFESFENFKTDYEFTSPAIPYQLLVTDRVKETDTTKWITKFYYPVF